MDMVSFENPTSCSACNAKEGEEEKRSCCKEEEAKCELVGFHSLPSYLKDNKFILDYYRCEWPLKQTVLSVFSIHNETLNIWTHLIGFFIFLGLAVCAVKMAPLYMPSSADHRMIQPSSPGGLPNASSVGYTIASPYAASEMLAPLSNCHLSQVLADFSLEKFSPANQTYKIVLSGVKDNSSNVVAAPPLVQPVTRWPFFVFLCGAMFCLFSSSACHLLSCHSKQCAYRMLRLDYTGIATLIVTSIHMIIYYSFMCDPFFRNLYTSFITILGVATVLGSLVPAFQTLEFRKVRLLLFVFLALSGWVPILHKVVAFSHRSEAIASTGYELLMKACYGAGVVVYATRVPERWMPGRFDIVGHSHQLFHVMVIAGTYAQYLAGLVYLQWRDLDGCSI